MRPTDISSVTPTICDLLGFDLPELSTGRRIDRVIKAAAEVVSGPIERCLIYSPDAVGTAVYCKENALFHAVLRLAPVEVPLLSVVPPKTPVCYASMFSGAPPEVHGIQTYIKRRLTCDTLFDAALRAGKRVAIVAVKASSMDMLFRGRGITYFSEAYDGQVTERTLKLLEADEHDLIVAYHQAYDDALHESGLKSPEALAALRSYLDSFSQLACACHSAWQGHSRLVAFAPDHGAHTDPATGKGTHGDNTPEDMDVTHFFGLSREG